MKIRTRADAGQWIRSTTEYERIIAKAATGAMRDVAKEGVAKGRERMEAAGFSSRFSSGLVGKAKPANGNVLNPSAYIHTRQNYADVFERGKDIGGKPFLWLPLPNVPPIGQRPHMSPSQYVRFVGPLFTIRRPGKPPMLGGRVTTVTTPFGRFTGKRALRQHGITSRGGKVETVILYVGVDAVHIPKKFDVKGAIEDSFEKMGNFYLQHLEKYEGR